MAGAAHGVLPSVVIVVVGDGGGVNDSASKYNIL